MDFIFFIFFGGVNEKIFYGNCCFYYGNEFFILCFGMYGYIDDYFKWFSYNVVFFHDVIAE